ncbi:unnamed protein product [Effrenium voratum]|uniref:C2CD3 N-terminal C2 domain-containing protein n=1 Tax=Effrenium voratum TaxID=2562239 RepID=A0AA36N9G3_9DINO|nr:unnamed protein product [Effrenium voratum]
MAGGVGLPPHVPGNVQGWLRAELRDLQLEEAGAAFSESAFGAFEWWGQDGECLPLRVAQSKELAESAEFSIRASPKCFAAYLQDMQFLRIHLYEGRSKVGLCEVNLHPWLRGPDGDYKVHVDRYFPVVRSHADRMMLGQVRVCLYMEWADSAELRCKKEALSSFEAHEWHAQLSERKAQPQPQPQPSSRSPLPGRCQHCGSELDSDARFCCHCGVRFNQRKEIPVASDGVKEVPSLKPEKEKEEDRGLYLQVHLCGMRLRRSALPDPDGMKIVYRLGVTEEVSVIAANGERADDLCFLLGSVKASTAPMWPNAGAPSLKSLHFHAWQGSSLVGLSTLQLPEASDPALDALSSFLLSRDVEIVSLSSGQVIGLLRVALYAASAKAALHRPSQLTSLPAPLPIEKKPPASGDGSGDELPREATPKLRKAEDSASASASAGCPDADACLWLVASGVSAEEVLQGAAAATPPLRSGGRTNFAVPLEDFCAALARKVPELTSQQALQLAQQAMAGPGESKVSGDLWRGLLRELSARVGAALDLLQEGIGGEELGWFAEQLTALGRKRVQKSELAALVGQKALPRWDLLDEVLRLLGASASLPAAPLARLAARRAEDFWRSRAAAAEAPEAEEAEEAEEECQGRTHVDSPATQLISGLLCLITAGELEVEEVVKQLDAAALEVSEAQPRLWCASDDVSLARILEDSNSVGCVLRAWQALRLPTSSSAAVGALRRLGTVEKNRLRVRHLADEQGGRPSARVFLALLAVGLGPQQLGSRLRTFCATAGAGAGNEVHLDQFSSCLQQAGVAMAWADVLNLGRGYATQHGLLDVGAFCKDFQAWLAQRSAQWPTGTEGSLFSDTLMSGFTRLDLPVYLLFACLDQQGLNFLPEAALQTLEQWPSPVSRLIPGARLLCDPAKRGVVTYGDFRRFSSYLDQLRPFQAERAELRAQLRAALAAEPTAAASAAAPAAPERRGLDGPADLAGLARMMRVTPSAGELLAGAFLAGRQTDGHGGLQPSYRDFLAMLQRAKALLRRHREDLPKHCLAASLDLQQVIYKLAPGEGRDVVVGWDALLAALEAEGLDRSKMDVEELACALDLSGRRQVSVAELLELSSACRLRHEPLLRHLAGGSSRGFQQLLQGQHARAEGRDVPRLMVRHE